MMVLEQEMINTIADIGRRRSPNEACGLVLPTPVNGVQVIELPNHSAEPEDSFELHGSDMMAALEQTLGTVTEEMLPGLTAWHTHPSGGVGPSRTDLRNKPAYLNSLVVTIFDDGRTPLATWF